MGTRRRDVRATGLGRFVRGWRPDRNPLRRSTDRVETAVLALLVIVFLAVAPFAALTSGSWALARAHQAQLAEQASSYQVPAVVLPGTSYVELALRAGEEVGCGVIQELTIEQIMPLATTGGTAVQVIVGRDDGTGSIATACSDVRSRSTARTCTSYCSPPSL